MQYVSSKEKKFKNSINSPYDLAINKGDNFSGSSVANILNDSLFHVEHLSASLIGELQ